MELSPYHRLLPSDVMRLERVLGGDPITEELILRFIQARYEAKSLFYLPPKVAVQILLRPTDFIREVKRYCDLTLPF